MFFGSYICDLLSYFIDVLLVLFAEKSPPVSSITKLLVVSGLEASTKELQFVCTELMSILPIFSQYFS